MAFDTGVEHPRTRVRVEQLRAALALADIGQKLTSHGVIY